MSGDPLAGPHRRRDTADTLEIERICALPIVGLPTPEEVEAVSQDVVQADALAKGFRLNREQAGALLAYDALGGCLGAIGVGRGKTFITILIADRAFRRGESKRSLLMVPPSVLDQLVKTDIPRARKLFGIRVPFTVLAGRTGAARLSAARSGRLGCYVMTYSLLSSRDAEAVLNEIAPDLVILDEAHRVKNRSAARTGRLLRVLDRKVQPQPRLVALSGTITNKSVRDYHHLATRALGRGAPMPLEPVLVDAWSALLDANAPEEANAAATGPLLPLVRWAARRFPEERLPQNVTGFRGAYRLRLNSAPGVVASGDADVGTSLTIRNVPVPSPEKSEGHAELVELERQVDELWISPSGDEIEHGMHKWRHKYELAAGFFYRLRWPTTDEVVVRRSCSHAEGAELLAMSQAHHDALNAYHKDLRVWLAHRGRPGMDTPFLVGHAMALRGADAVGDPELFAAWRAAKDLEFPGMPERISEPVRVCPWKVRHAARAAVLERDAAVEEGAPPGVLVWYYHHDVGRWLVDELEALGAEPLWCPAEARRPGSNERILHPDSAQRIVVASMAGHGEGKNLQAFQRQVLVEFPRKADLLEQVLGRTHRQGQLADELVPVTLNTSEFDHQNMFAALIDALYVHQSTGSRQKAIYATYDPLPRVYPPEFLRERGFTDLATLDPATRAALEEKFGISST